VQLDHREVAPGDFFVFQSWPAYSAIHAFGHSSNAWMRGTSPRMTVWRVARMLPQVWGRLKCKKRE